MRRLLLSSLLLVLALGAIAIPGRTPPASAADAAPCRPSYQLPSGLSVQDCPLWRGNVPVYRFENGQVAEEVGRLNLGGTANWFECQFQFTNEPYSFNGATNNWWAYTMADNGQWGWVPEVFFEGGDDFEADSGLALCFGG